VQHGGLAPWQLRRVRDHVEENLARDIPLAELSALVRLSSYHFCRAFARSTGLPPHRWIQTRRIEHAKALLARPEGTILEVAAQVGYDNPGHFAKVFRKLVGMTPREFRRAL
jgi:AraC family transcriptional regulator